MHCKLGCALLPLAVAPSLLGHSLLFGCTAPAWPVLLFWNPDTTILPPLSRRPPRCIIEDSCRRHDEGACWGLSAFPQVCTQEIMILSGNAEDTPHPHRWHCRLQQEGMCLHPCCHSPTPPARAAAIAASKEGGWTGVVKLGGGKKSQQVAERRESELKQEEQQKVGKQPVDQLSNFDSSPLLQVGGIA